MKNSWWKISLFSLLIAFILIALFLPQLLSTPLGKPFFEKALTQRLQMPVHIKTLHLSWFGPQLLQNISFANEEMQGSFEEVKSSVPLWKISELGNDFSLKNGKALFSHSTPPLQITQIEAIVQNNQVRAHGVGQNGGYFQIQGTIYSKKHWDLQADLKEMPSPLVDQWLHANSLFTNAVGPFLNMNLTANLKQASGSVDLLFQSSNANAKLSANIQNQTLLLKAPLQADLVFTQELAKILKHRFNFPLISVKRPITLQIDPKNTRIPFFPFSSANLEIGHAKLDLGQAQLDKVKGLLSLLAFLHQGAGRSSQIPIWFAPFDFSINKGILNLERTDALVASSVHLCAWGKLNLPSNRLNMILGIVGDTLRSALGIPNISSSYVLQIPVGGTLQDPAFDLEPAKGKITLWMTQDQLSKKTGILGNVINLMIPSGDDDNDAPPPKRPFPWEG